jgi:hypothetical protein
MIQKIRRKLLVLSTILMLLAPAVTVGTVAAVSSCSSSISSNIAKGVTESSPSGTDSVSCDPSGVDDTSITKLARSIVTTFSIVVGAASVIMIIYGGFRYITSGGESGRVGNAKNALLYAIVGLVIVALAQLIIHFVLNQANNLGT